jgi:hypothetical protein
VIEAGLTYCATRMLHTCKVNMHFHLTTYELCTVLLTCNTASLHHPTSCVKEAYTLLQLPSHPLLWQQLHPLHTLPFSSSHPPNPFPLGPPPVCKYSQRAIRDKHGACLDMRHAGYTRETAYANRVRMEQTCLQEQVN